MPRREIYPWERVRPSHVLFYVLQYGSPTPKGRRYIKATTRIDYTRSNSRTEYLPGPTIRPRIFYSYNISEAKRWRIHGKAVAFKRHLTSACRYTNRSQGTMIVPIYELGEKNEPIDSSRR